MTVTTSTEPANVPTQSARVTRAAGVVMAGSFLIYVCAGLREVLIARTFGATHVADAYLIAFALPLIVSSIADSVLATPFVQVLAGYLARGEREAVWRIIGSVLNLLSIAMLTIIAIGVLIAPWLIGVAAPGFDAPTNALASRLAQQLFPMIGLLVLFAMARGVLNAHRTFTFPLFGALINHLAVIAFLLLAAPIWGIGALVAGVLFGAFAQLVIQIPALRAHRLRYLPVLDLAHPGVRSLLSLAALVTLGGVLQRIGEFVVRALASDLGDGMIAALTYASRLSELASTIFTSSILMAALPTIVAALDGSARPLALRTVDQTMRAVLVIIVPVAIALATLAMPLVQLLFGSQAFNAQAVMLTSQALTIYALGLIPTAFLLVCAQVLYVLGDARRVVVFSLIGVCTQIGLGLVLAGTFAHRGLALATMIGVATTACCCYGRFCQRLPDLPMRVLYKLFAQLSAAAGVMAVVMSMAGSLFPYETMPQQLVHLSAVGILGLMSYLSSAWLLRVDEVRMIPGMLRTIVGRI